MIGTIPWMIVSASSAGVRRFAMNRIAAAPGCHSRKAEPKPELRRHHYLVGQG